MIRSPRNRNVRWLFTAILTPVALFAAVFFGTAVDTAQAQQVASTDKMRVASDADSLAGLQDIAPLKPTLDHSRVSGKILLELQRSHFNTIRIDDELSSDLFDAYIKTLDPYRRYFLASDIERFERYRNYLDDALRKGDLAPAFEIYQVWMQRRLERFEFLTAALDKGLDKLDFTLDETLETDRENAAWLTDTAEADVLWQKYFKDDVLRLRLGGSEQPEIRDVLGKRYERQMQKR